MFRTNWATCKKFIWVSRRKFFYIKHTSSFKVKFFGSTTFKIFSFIIIWYKFKKWKKLIIVSKYRSCHTSDWKQKARSNQFGIKLVLVWTRNSCSSNYIPWVGDKNKIKGFLNYFVINGFLAEIVYARLYQY